MRMGDLRSIHTRFSHYIGVRNKLFIYPEVRTPCALVCDRGHSEDETGMTLSQG